MTGPCVANTATIDLVTTGSPEILTAELVAESDTFSGTEGDTGHHVVTDGGVVHSQTATFTITNPFATKRVQGLVIASFDPIYLVPGPTITEYDFETHLHIGGLEQDARIDSLAWDFATASQNPFYIPLRALLGQLNLAGGASTTVVIEKQISNGGPSQTWEYNLGGDKLETMVI